MGFSRQEYWSGLLFPAPHLGSSAFQVDSLPSESPGIESWEAIKSQSRNAWVRWRSRGVVVLIKVKRVRQPHRIPQASVGPAKVKQFPSTWNSMTQVQTLDDATQAGSPVWGKEAVEWSPWTDKESREILWVYETGKSHRKEIKHSSDLHGTVFIV